MYNVVCVKYGDKYDPEYVNKLYGMVKRNLTLPFTFYCFTEDPENINPEIEIRPLNDDLHTWWHKLTLFKSTVHDLVGRTLYLDLDVVIVDNIDCFFDYIDPFIIIKDWNSRENNIFWNSSVFSFDIGTFSYVWEKFNVDPERHMKKVLGDQTWLWKMIPKEDITIWPEEWCRSYKYDCSGGTPEDSKIIIFHGQPNPHNAINYPHLPKHPTDWISKYWVE